MFKNNQSGLANLMVIGVLAAAIGLGVILINQRTGLLSRAFVNVDSTPPYMALVPTTATINKNCNLNVDIQIDTNNHSIVAANALVSYDPTKLMATSVDNGAIFESSDSAKQIDNQLGKVTFTATSSAGTPFTGIDNLARIKFTPLAEASEGATPVTIDINSADNSSKLTEKDTLNNILNSVSNATYTIATGDCESTPSATPTSTPSATPTPSEQPSSSPTASATPSSTPEGSPSATPAPAPEPKGPTSKDQCKKGGWKSFTSPKFKNQGQCIKSIVSKGKKPQGLIEDVKDAVDNLLAE